MIHLRLGPKAPPADPLVPFASVSAVLLLLARFFPFETRPVFFCPLRTLSGVPCPGCGMTRAFVRVTHGDLPAALHVSPLGTLLAIAASALVVYTALRLTVLRRGVELHVRGWRWGLIGAVAANWVYLLVTGAAG